MHFYHTSASFSLLLFIEIVFTWGPLLVFICKLHVCHVTLHINNYLRINVIV